VTEIVLPAGTMFVTVREIPGLLARAIHPTPDDGAVTPAPSNGPLSDDDLESLPRWSPEFHNAKMCQVIDAENHKSDLHSAISRGELVALNLSRLRIPASATGAQVDNAIVMIDALKAYALPMGVTVRADTPQAAPVVAVEPASDSPTKRRPKKPSIEVVALDYMREVYQSAQFASAAKFHAHLCKIAGQGNSPFEKGAGVNAKRLFCPEAGSFFDPATLGNLMPKIRPQ
jgi:hypothetical protein